MDADGGNVTQITEDSLYDSNPDWSPDGSKIVFAHAESKSLSGDIPTYMMDADGNNPVGLTQFSGFNPVWSPDGSGIALLGTGPGVAKESGIGIYVMNADGSNVQNLTPGAYYVSSPAWSPDGSKIAYYSRSDPSRDDSDEVLGSIYAMNADGSNPVRLILLVSLLPEGHPIKLTGSVFKISWSPAGDYIAFAVYSRVFVMRADGSNPVRLMEWDEGSPFGAVDWSPDGRRLVFVSNRDGNDEIYVAEFRIP